MLHVEGSSNERLHVVRGAAADAAGDINKVGRDGIGKADGANGTGGGCNVRLGEGGITGTGTGGKIGHGTIGGNGGIDGATRHALCGRRGRISLLQLFPFTEHRSHCKLSDMREYSGRTWVALSFPAATAAASSPSASTSRVTQPPSERVIQV